MKSKFFTLLALGLATMSQAATYDVYITGSTAGRSSVHNAINSIFGPFTTTAGAKTKAWTNTDPTVNAETSATKATYLGGTNGDGHVYNIHVAWSGSAAGVESLTSNNNVAFLTEAVGGFITSPAAFTNHVADIAFSDVYQATTAFKTPTLNDDLTIVLPFKVVTSERSPITNATPQLLRTLFTTGISPLALWTNLTADETKGVFAAGRDASSGTRITVLAEIGMGGTSSVSQWEPVLDFFNEGLVSQTTPTTITLNVTGSTVTHKPVTAVGGVQVGQPVRGTGIPAGTKVQSVTDSSHFVMTASTSSPGNQADNAIRLGQNAASANPVGDGGASSGGTVASYVAATTEGFGGDFGFTNAYFVSYLGLSDASTAVTNGAVEVPFNGVTYSAAGVQNGLYSMWGYLHLYRRDLGTTPAQVDTVADALIPYLKANPGSSGLNPTLMKVKRLSDGGDVTATYF